MSWKNNRPDGWSNPYHKTGDFGDGEQSWNEQPEFSAYEDGADAILEALKKEGIYKVETGREWRTEAFRRRKGWVVLIPEE